MTVLILVGDALTRLRELADASVDLVCTSPPYFGLRDYDTARWEGGRPDCDHAEGQLRRGVNLAKSAAATRGGGKKIAAVGNIQYRAQCAKCGAVRIDQQIGLEPTPEAYLERLVEVFREIRRVLRPSGTVWVNMGDSYFSPRWSGGTGHNSTINGKATQEAFKQASQRRLRVGASGNKAHPSADVVEAPNRNRALPGLKPKDLLGMPWRLALALQADGWFLRRDIIWHKLNPMPESVIDRPTSAHEYVFLFSKSGKPTCWRHRDGTWTWSRPKPDYIWRHPRTKAESDTARDGWQRINLWVAYDYFYEAKAIMEPSSPDSHARAARGRSSAHKWADGGPGDQSIAKGNPSPGRLVKSQGAASREALDWTPGPSRKGGVTPKAALAPTGTGSARVKQNPSYSAALGTADLVPMRNKRSVWPIATEAYSGAHFAVFPTKLAEPCILAGCPAGGTVLDPFGGAGTTAVVADRHHRNAILIELNRGYAESAQQRVIADGGMFTKVALRLAPAEASNAAA